MNEVTKKLYTSAIVRKLMCTAKKLTSQKSSRRAAEGNYYIVKKLTGQNASLSHQNKHFSHTKILVAERPKGYD